jgi:hypothetical protein
MSEQHLLMLTAGAVFLDAPGQLTRARTALAYYPHDVWLYLLAAQWAYIGQYEALVGRADEVGDELGSRLICARLVHDIMHLAFLLERTYAPYAKWFGTAFQRLQCASELAPHLAGALAANDRRTRERHLLQSLEWVYVEVRSKIARYGCAWPEVVVSRHRTLCPPQPVPMRSTGRTGVPNWKTSASWSVSGNSGISPFAIRPPRWNRARVVYPR